MTTSQRKAYKNYSATLSGRLARAKANAQYWQREYDRLKAEAEAEESQQHKTEGE